MQVYFLLATVAVTIAVPGALAVIFPLLFTVATEVFEDFHVTFCAVSNIFNVQLPFLYKVTDVLLILGASTLILHVYFLFCTLAVITAVPFALAVTFPLLLTTAIFLFEELHTIFTLVPVSFRPGIKIMNISFSWFSFRALFNMLSAIQANAPLYKSTPDNPDSDNTNPN